jgi:chloramphenicol O-acetyltransferase type A
MDIKKIDMESYTRRAHFEYFNAMAYPYAGMTVNVDITELYNYIKKEGLPFFLTVLYAAVNATNSVPELRRRIQDGGIVEYDFCPASYTLALEDGTYCYCRLDCNMSYQEFLKYAKEQQNNARNEKNMEDKADVNSLLFVSCIPWVSFTSLVQPVPCPADSNPRITFGKYFKEGNRILMPIALLVHHGLADGIHISRFYESFSQFSEKLCLQL